MLGRTENIIGQGDELLGPDTKSRLFECLALSAGKVAFSYLEVTTRELPLACAVLVWVTAKRIAVFVPGL
jgi:hypothetical protein